MILIRQQEHNRSLHHRHRHPPWMLPEHNHIRHHHHLHDCECYRRQQWSSTGDSFSMF
ncbi:hypothetical protein OIU79_018083 [Salix purpurea]|uniref:Uncharacterized protein n=1 Tax=Salix purpurea TaxID=77065 RepID=A0A9Q0WWI1_SALPP|nr:hypothetical protein OIU79_018083 [Salix purpurea]